MTCSELIKQLQSIMQDMGDQEVHLDSIGWHIADVKFESNSGGHGVVLRSDMLDDESILVGASG